MALKRAQVKYAMTIFKWNYEALAVVVRVSRTMQNSVISRYYFFDENGKEK